MSRRVFSPDFVDKFYDHFDTKLERYRGGTVNLFGQSDDLDKLGTKKSTSCPRNDKPRQSLNTSDLQSLDFGDTPIKDTQNSGFTVRQKTVFDTDEITVYSLPNNCFQVSYSDSNPAAEILASLVTNKEGNYDGSPNNCFVLYYGLSAYETTYDDPTFEEYVKLQAKKVEKPYIDLASTQKTTEVFIPKIKYYQDFVLKIGGYFYRDHYRLAYNRLPDFLSLNETLKLPPFRLSKEIEKIVTEPLPGFDGSLVSLKNVDVSELFTIQIAANKDDKVYKGLKKLNISSCYDLVMHLPRRYIDRSAPSNLRYLLDGDSCTLCGTITSIAYVDSRVGFTEIVIDKVYRAVFWRQKWIKTKFKEGDNVLITGTVNLFRGAKSVTGTNIELTEVAGLLPIMPVYKQSPSMKIDTALLLAAIREVFLRTQKIYLPSYLRVKENVEGALKEIHTPTSFKDRAIAMRQMSLMELIYLEVLILKEKEEITAADGVPCSLQNSKYHWAQKCLEALPYKLTGAQVKALKRIKQKIILGKPYHALINAEVGAGKTIIAQMACLMAADSGHQAILTAPTAILARQLYDTFQKVIAPLDNKPVIEYYDVSAKAKDRKELDERIAKGETQIIIGTVGLLSKRRKYKDIALICIDEQQKFGVEQRSELLDFRQDGKIPHILMQTATPIPRSFAQAIYGEIEMITLNERPPGRLPVETELIECDPIEFCDEYSPVWDDVIEQSEEGYKTFIVAPAVYESTKRDVDIVNVEKVYKMLNKGILKNVNIAMVHGGLSREENDRIIGEFRDGNVDVLIGSTVLEVGVDVSKATRIIILGADRLGASSLHQLRGRVGRNSIPSKCYLVSNNDSENSLTRLNSLVESNDGYHVAQVDMKTRGTGNIFDVKQSGDSGFVFADITKNSEIINIAKQRAKTILDSDYRDIAIKEAQTFFQDFSDEKMV